MQYSVLFLHGKLITIYRNHFFTHFEFVRCCQHEFSVMRCWIEKDFFLVSPDDKKKVDIEDTTAITRERDLETTKRVVV